MTGESTDATLQQSRSPMAHRTRHQRLRGTRVGNSQPSLWNNYNFSISIFRYYTQTYNPPQPDKLTSASFVTDKGSGNAEPFFIARF